MKYMMKIFRKYLIQFLLENRKMKIQSNFEFIHRCPKEDYLIDYRINQIVDHLDRRNRI